MEDRMKCQRINFDLCLNFEINHFCKNILSCKLFNLSVYPQAF